MKNLWILNAVAGVLSALMTLIAAAHHSLGWVLYFGFLTTVNAYFVHFRGGYDNER